MSERIPWSRDDNYSEEIIAARQHFIEQRTGVKLQHLKAYSFDPNVTRGNIENFTGVAQVPIGFAGPLRINGEYAQGEFIIPLATTEGTLVASYNRGMKVLNLSGGVKTTVVMDQMQRAPVFVFDSAREARAFWRWIDDHFNDIKEIAESTTRHGKLKSIERYQANKFIYLRFNYTTGDAAGQNMVGRATWIACMWIASQNPTVRRWYLESNFATDKKASQINMMMTRGKRVTAEATIPRDVLIEHLRATPESLHYHYMVSNVAGFVSGVNNNGLHSANGITAMFIATGQDVACVSESSAGILYAEITPTGDFYLSITIPSLIVGTYGGGTGLPTQRECLEILGCYGKDKVYKFTEIVAGVVLAGELSLGAAISSQDWVTSHEQYGRNR
ncbi:MAG: hydroxymethylglutaryl-CoA reductase [Acidobacteria bacterium]|nr:MAG: hydroxymethylglutaryl-CoA reductase [Acidobacteriota bacterium]